MQEETIEVVVPSEEGGNGLPTETPKEEASTATPAEPVETTEPVEPKEELYELPDGRKVDAETLSKEWKENFYPDYTRKSQELAKVKNPEPINNNDAPNSPYSDPEYVPQSYEELLQVAEERALKAFEAKEKAIIEERQAIESQVVSQLNEIKSVDPNLNENALFLHATKYGFDNLKMAYDNMKDMNAVIKKTQTTTAQNIAKRNDPVSASPGATGQRPDPSQFENAREYLRSIKQ